jgi:hypothetical protein
MQDIPAFPRDNSLPDWSGMTLRDYFAGRVLQAYESRQDLDDIHLTDKVQRVYCIADAMMKAREA